MALDEKSLRKQDERGGIGKAASIAVAAAAGTAGIGAAGSAQAAVIGRDLSATPLPVNSSQNQLLNYNQDAFNDADFIVAGDSLRMTKPDMTTKVSFIGDSVEPEYAAALPLGEIIGDNDTFNTTASGFLREHDSVNEGTLHGQFSVAAGAKYLGIQFGDATTQYYGWVGFRTTNEAKGSMAGEIFGYGYEDTVGVPIAAGAVPEPTSLALLAMGAAGLCTYRGRRGGKR